MPVYLGKPTADRTLAALTAPADETPDEPCAWSHTRCHGTPWGRAGRCTTHPRPVRWVANWQVGETSFPVLVTGPARQHDTGHVLVPVTHDASRDSEAEVALWSAVGFPRHVLASEVTYSL